MSSQNTKQECGTQTTLFDDPGNLLIVGYMVVVLFFIIFGGLVAARFSAQDIQQTSTVINETLEPASRLVIPN